MLSKLTNTSIRILGIIMFVAIMNSFSKDDDEPKKWLTIYSDVTLGDQENLINGHFSQPATGQSIKLEDSNGLHKSLAMMFFTESGGRNTFFTFPANGETSATFGTSNII